MLSTKAGKQSPFQRTLYRQRRLVLRVKILKVKKISIIFLLNALITKDKFLKRSKNLLLQIILFILLNLKLMHMIYYYVLEMVKSKQFQLEEEEDLDMVCLMRSTGINQRMKCSSFSAIFLIVFTIFLI